MSRAPVWSPCFHWMPKHRMPLLTQALTSPVEFIRYERAKDATPCPPPTVHYLRPSRSYVFSGKTLDDKAAIKASIVCTFDLSKLSPRPQNASHSLIVDIVLGVWIVRAGKQIARHVHRASLYRREFPCRGPIRRKHGNVVDANRGRVGDSCQSDVSATEL